MKINCNDGCLDNYPGNCVKYTGTQITNPLIVQNETLNNVINILVNTINSIPGGANDVYVNTPIDLSEINNANMNASYPNAFLGFSVHFTNVTGFPDAVYRISKYDTTNNFWLYFVGSKIP